MENENKNKNKGADGKGRRGLIVRLYLPRVVLALVVMGVVAFVVWQFVGPSDDTMDSRLEARAMAAFDDRLKDRGEGSYTLNLDYLERSGYDVAEFVGRGCSGTGTYVVLRADREGNIVSVSSNLECTKL